MKTRQEIKDIILAFIQDEAHKDDFNMTTSPILDGVFVCREMCRNWFFKNMLIHAIDHRITDAIKELNLKIAPQWAAEIQKTIDHAHIFNDLYKKMFATIEEYAAENNLITPFTEIKHIDWANNFSTSSYKDFVKHGVPLNVQCCMNLSNLGLMMHYYCKELNLNKRDFNIVIKAYEDPDWVYSKNWLDAVSRIIKGKRTPPCMIIALSERLPMPLRERPLGTLVDLYMQARK